MTCYLFTLFTSFPKSLHGECTADNIFDTEIFRRRRLEYGFFSIRDFYFLWVIGLREVKELKSFEDFINLSLKKYYDLFFGVFECEMFLSFIKSVVSLIEIGETLVLLLNPYLTLPDFLIPRF